MSIRKITWIQIAWILVVGFLLPASIRAQDAAFDVNNIAEAVVQLINLEENLPPQTGVFVTSDGMIVTANVDGETFLEGDEAQISIFSTINSPPTPAYLGVVIAVDDVIAVLRITSDIEGNEIDTSALDLTHYNPIERTVTADLLETVFAVSYSQVGGGVITTTRGQINGFDKIQNETTPELLPELQFYQSNVTLDFQGLGSPLVTFSGDFVGIAIELPVEDRGPLTDDVLVQVAPVTTLCATIRSICMEIVEGYRATPENRTTRPAGMYWLENGIGLTTNASVPRGEIEVEYYCEMMGLRARMSADETVWECYTNVTGETQYVLDSFDYDVICQQTYRNPNAVAIQDGNRFVSEANRWRCYG
jgi:hypothetical protein